MFEPEYLNLACPSCHHPEVYFDREVGIYCMFCGRRFGTEETQRLCAREILRARQRSGRSVTDWQAVAQSDWRRRAIWSHLSHWISRLFMTGMRRL